MTKGDSGEEVLMGDLVLTQEEVNPVMSALLDHGHGKATDLADQIKPAVDLIGHAPTAATAPKSTTSAPAAGALDTARIAKIVGHEGEQNGAVYKITIGRDDLSVKEMGATINARMGLNTWAAFVEPTMTPLWPAISPCSKAKLRQLSRLYAHTGLLWSRFTTT